jgi:hypothetical protein
MEDSLLLSLNLTSQPKLSSDSREETDTSSSNGNNDPCRGLNVLHPSPSPVHRLSPITVWVAESLFNLLVRGHHCNLISGVACVLGLTYQIVESHAQFW